jgi:hypothetical protein
MKSVSLGISHQDLMINAKIVGNLLKSVPSAVSCSLSKIKGTSDEVPFISNVELTEVTKYINRYLIADILKVEIKQYRYKISDLNRKEYRYSLSDLKPVKVRTYRYAVADLSGNRVTKRYSIRGILAKLVVSRYPIASLFNSTKVHKYKILELGSSKSCTKTFRYSLNSLKSKPVVYKYPVQSLLAKELKVFRYTILDLLPRKLHVQRYDISLLKPKEFKYHEYLISELASECKSNPVNDAPSIQVPTPSKQEPSLVSTSAIENNIGVSDSTQKTQVDTNITKEDSLFIPKDIVEFLKMYPNLREVQEVHKYFSKQVIDQALLTGRIFKRKNKYKI